MNYLMQKLFYFRLIEVLLLHVDKFGLALFKKDSVCVNTEATC